MTDKSEYELRICNHAHKCNYGKDNVGGRCAYAKPREERKNERPMTGHCITVNGTIRTVPFNAGQKSKDPNVSFRIHKVIKNLGIN